MNGKKMLSLWDMTICMNDRHSRLIPTGDRMSPDGKAHGCQTGSSDAQLPMV